MAATPTQQPGMTQQTMDPLAELRDIHHPAMIETWPPAIGWWLLATLALVALLAVMVWLFRRWYANKYRRDAMAELAHLADTWQSEQDDLRYVESLQLLLKRVALTRFPRQDVASLTGEAWVRFLDQSTGSHDFTIGATEALIDGNYRTDVSIDVDELQTAAALWINKHDIKHFLEAQAA